MRRAVLLLAGGVALGGCVFRGAEQPRFFRPASAALEAAAGAPDPAPAADGSPIRLRAVRSEPFLRERIVWRVSPVEYGLYEQRRWIDLPAHYVERALESRLRATPGLRLTDDDPHAVPVRVDVLAFDDVLAPAHAAKVSLAVTVGSATRGPLLERTFDAQVAVADGDPSSVAQAMGQALDDAVGQVADAVRAATRTRRPPSRRH